MAEQELLDKKKYVTDRKVYWFFKRLQDFVLSFLAIIVLSPLMVIVGLAVVIGDPKGGPFYSQVRVGRDGKLFKMHKFRSMYVNAEADLDKLLDQNEMDGPVFKIKNDPRITKVGKFIRKTSLDELPQLFNILCGEMSIVGPRPAIPREVEQYNDYQRQRLLTTPGITCIWQIQPHRNDLSFDEWVDLDVEYIKKRSFLFDWLLIFKTVGAVLKLDGE